MKISKAKWDQFWTDLGEDWYMDETDCPDDSAMAPSDVLTITCGHIAWQGSSDEESPKVPSFLTKGAVIGCIRGDVISLMSALKKWEKHQSTVTIVIEVERSREAEVREAIAALLNKQR